MPEGDTIARWADQLRDAIEGKTLRRLDYRRDPRGVRPPAPGTVVDRIEARGKHLLVHFGDGATLHTHMRLDGSWRVYEPGGRWRRPDHAVRVVIEVEDGTRAVCFSAPVVELTRTQPAIEHLGPDLLAPETDLDDVLARLVDLDPETDIGSVLLDQRVAAGLGNVFKSETCWAVRVNPLTHLGALDVETRRALYETGRRQLAANVGPGRRVTYAGGLAVYRKDRRPCPRCRTPIRRAMTGDPARVSYWCPACQPAP